MFIKLLNCILNYFSGKVIKKKVINDGTKNLVSGIQIGDIGGIYPEYKGYSLEENSCVGNC